MGSQLNSFTRLPSVCLLLFAFRGVPFEAKVAMVKESKDGDNIHMTRSVFRLIYIFGIQWHLPRCGAQRAGKAQINWVCTIDTLTHSKVNVWSDRRHGKGTWKTWYKGQAAKGRLQRAGEGQICQAGLLLPFTDARLTDLSFPCPLQLAFCSMPFVPSFPGAFAMTSIRPDIHLAMTEGINDTHPVDLSFACPLCSIP